MGLVVDDIRGADAGVCRSCRLGSAAAAELHSSFGERADIVCVAADAGQAFEEAKIMSLPYDTDWICSHYRMAKNKRETIRILAELNICSKKEIRQLLSEAGYELPKEREPTRREKTIRNIETCRGIADAGGTPKEAAEACKLSVNTIYNLAIKNGIKWRTSPKTKVAR